MADVTCSRCGRHAPGLEKPPLPGRTGERIRSQVCAACWQEWLSTQVRYINEYRLSPLDPKHFDFLMAQARTFLNIKDE